jgi:hypothetical protein
MNQYEIYMQKSTECQQKARAASCLDLRQFYINAAAGFEIKARNLKLSEVTK